MFAGQEDLEDYLEDEHEPETVWRSNYPTVSELAEKVEEVLEDHTEEEAKRLYPGPVIVSLGARHECCTTEPMGSQLTGEPGPETKRGVRWHQTKSVG